MMAKTRSYRPFCNVMSYKQAFTLVAAEVDP